MYTDSETYSAFGEHVLSTIEIRKLHACISWLRVRFAMIFHASRDMYFVHNRLWFAPFYLVRLTGDALPVTAWEW